MSVAATNAATNIGINMNTLAAAGGVGLILGGIDFNKTNTATLQIGNSSTTANGILQLNGATINSTANTLIRVAGSSNLTIADVNAGSGTQTMGLRLGTTTGIFEVGTSRTLTVSSIISQSATGYGFTKTGAGTLDLTRANTFTGAVNHNGGIISVSNPTSLGSGTFTFGGYNKLIANVADGASMNLANNMVLPSTGTGGEAELIRVGDATPTAGTTLRLSGILSGGATGQTYTLVDSDAGGNHTASLILDNASNTFTGTIEIWRGTLGFTSDGALGNANNTIRVNAGSFNGGLRFDADNINTGSTRTFELAGSEKIDTQAFTSTISGSITGGTFRKIGSGSLTLGGTNTFIGTTNVAGGNLRVSGGAALPDATAVSLDNTAGAGLELLASETIGTLAGGGTTGGNVNLNDKTLTVSAATATSYAGAISGTGGVLTKTGNSVFTLTGASSYNGGTNLNAGSLSINNGNALGTGAIRIGSAATSGTGGSVSTLFVSSTAATTLSNDIALPTPASATTYTIMKAAATASTGTELNLTGNLSGGNANSTLRLNSNTGGDTTTTYRFAGNGTLQGAVELFRGAFVIANANALGSAKLLLNGNNNTTLGDLRFATSMTFANDIDLVNTSNPDPIHTQGNTVNLSGIISSTGNQALVKIGTGTLALSGPNTYNVATTISGGTLQVGNGGTTGTLGNTSGVTNNATLAFNRNDALSVSQGISGTGSVVKAGAGTTTLTGTNSYSGATEVDTGTLLINGSHTGTGAFNVDAGATLGGTGNIAGAINVSGVLSPGTSIQTLSSGALSFLSGSTYAYEVNSSVALATAADLQVVAGTLGLTGTVDLTLIDLAITPQTFADNTTFSLINYSGAWNNGLFRVNGNTIADGGTFSAFNTDWILDYNATSGGSNFAGEFLTSSNFVNMTAIPEPTVPALLVIGSALLFRRRRA